MQYLAKNMTLLVQNLATFLSKFLSGTGSCDFLHQHRYTLLSINSDWIPQDTLFKPSAGDQNLAEEDDNLNVIDDTTRRDYMKQVINKSYSVWYWMHCNSKQVANVYRQTNLFDEKKIRFVTTLYLLYVQEVVTQPKILNPTVLYNLGHVT